MRKITITLLAVLLACSFCLISVFAVDYTSGTRIEYVATGNIQYTVTVPAFLSPGQSGSVTVAGQWPSNAEIRVAPDSEVVLTNSINKQEQVVLPVVFDEMNLAGNDVNTTIHVNSISVDSMPENVLFGIWSGKINYTVDFFTYELQTNTPYVLSYLIDGFDSEACPTSAVLNEDGSVAFQFGDTTVLLPDGNFSQQGRNIVIFDDSIEIYVSDDNSKISLFKREPHILIAEWTLKQD